MKNYQDTETGQIYAFDDGIDPFTLNYRTIPSTLSETVIPKPSESHVWLDGNWVADTEAPKNYKPPISSVTAYDPAWAAFLNPYTFIIADRSEYVEISIDQINSNTYDNTLLSKTVTSLPLTNNDHLYALVSYDGAIAIPRNIDYPSSNIALDNINRIFCAILLGGEHTEVVGPELLLNGSILENTKDIFIYQDGRHSRLRHKWASLNEKIILTHPRIICISDLRNAYMHGIKIINSINNLSPFFLLHGYSAMVYRNRSDALSSLWIVVEQLTSFLWENRFLTTSNLHPKMMNDRKKSLKEDNRTWSTSVKHELLWQTKFLSEDCFSGLSKARKQRNNLVHEGTVPDFEVVRNLWNCIFELIESASGIDLTQMRRLIPVEADVLTTPGKTNFDAWKILSKSI